MSVTYSAPVASNPIVARMIGAAMLNVHTYEEVEADSGATSQAAIVVGLAALSSGLAAFRAGVVPGVVATIVGFVAAYLGWVVMSYITYFVGTRMFDGKADVGELMRTLGFAQAPRIAGFLGIIPVLGGLINFILAFWCLATAFVAIRQALDVDNTKAAITAVISWVAAWVIIAIPMMMMAVIMGVVGGVLGG